MCVRERCIGIYMYICFYGCVRVCAFVHCFCLSKQASVSARAIKKERERGRAQVSRPSIKQDEKERTKMSGKRKSEK